LKQLKSRQKPTRQVACFIQSLIDSVTYVAILFVLQQFCGKEFNRQHRLNTYTALYTELCAIERCA